MTDTVVVEGLAGWELEAVSAINNLELVAHRSETEASDTRWDQAAKVVEALDLGMTQRKVADGWKRQDGTSYSQAHVSYVKKTWDTFGYHLSDRPSWNVAYNSPEVRGGDPGPHVSHNSGEIEWYTPPQYLEAARRVMGGIDLDPASSDRANELVQATVHFTRDDDGLRRPWAGRVWMNPPYSKDLMWLFCERLCEFYEAGDVSKAIVLVNNATETAAFQRMAELASAMCFPAKRIKYLNSNLEAAKTPLQGQTFLYFGGNVERFRTEFTPFGFTVTT